MRSPKSLLAIFTCLLLLASCDEKDKPRCLPGSLNINDDSLVFIYDGGRKLGRVEYHKRWLGPSQPHRKIELTYNAGRKLETVTVSNQSGDLTYWVEDKFTLHYGSSGLPDSMEDKNYLRRDSRVITVFTHDEQGRLLSATTNVVPDDYPEYPFFIGGYRYEYNIDGNVSKVYYTNNVAGGTEEALARENLTFDNNAPFYFDPEGLATMNIYCFRSIPNINNNLTARVTYLDYGVKHQQAMDITFDIQYDQEGRVTSVTTNDVNVRPYRGELLFSSISFDCM